MSSVVGPLRRLVSQPYTSAAFDIVATLYPHRLPLQEAVVHSATPKQRSQWEELKRRAASTRNSDDKYAIADFEQELAEQYRLEKLATAQHTAVGIVPPLVPSSKLQVVTSTVWRVLQIDVADNWSAYGSGLKLIHIEVATSLCVEKKPAPQGPEFVHNEDYSKVSIRGHDFQLSPIPAKIVKLLHEAWKNGTPSVGVKELLHQAGTAGTDISDHFKRYPNWRELIARESKGFYRLNLTSKEGAASKV